MKKILLALVLTQASVLSVASENSTLKSEFQSAYQAYQSSINSDDSQLKLRTAQKAYELGRELYGDKGINSAKLALNYVVLLHKETEKNNADEIESFISKTYKNIYGDNSKELINLYYTFAKSISWSNSHKRNNYLDQMLIIASSLDESDPMLAAATRLTTGKEFINLSNKKGKVVIDALDYFSKKFSDDEQRVVEAKFWVGKYYLMMNKQRKAISALTSNLPVFEKIKGANHPLELVTHAFLVQAYENKGMSDEATKHCKAIGSMKPWDDTQEPSPLYRINPEYPIEMAAKGKSGFVTLKFTITDIGTIDDIEVLEYKGKSFVKPAKKALSKWRYAPKFVDGKAIAAKNQTVQLDFTISPPTA